MCVGEFANGQIAKLARRCAVALGLRWGYRGACYHERHAGTGRLRGFATVKESEGCDVVHGIAAVLGASHSRSANAKT